MRLALVAAVAVLACASTAIAESPASSGVSLSGKIANPQTLPMAALRALPASHVTGTQVSGHGPVPFDCTGPAVSVLLEKAAPVTDGRKNAALGLSLLVTAQDGYRAALSFGEMDPDYGGAAPILATDCGGKPLDAPKLLVPGDKHAGRSVRAVVSLEVR